MQVCLSVCEPGRNTWMPAFRRYHFARNDTAARDSRGRPLGHVPWGVRHVNAGEVWLFGFKDAHSWDSRYYGPLPLGAVRWLVTPVLTLGASKP